MMDRAYSEENKRYVDALHDYYNPSRKPSSRKPQIFGTGLYKCAVSGYTILLNFVKK
jgi:hypothetical protein